MSDHWLDEILEWFNELENDLSGVSRAVFNIVIGEIPDSKIDSVYALAEAWENAASRLAEIQGEVVDLAEPIIEGWQGDTAASQFAQQWFAYQQGLNGGVQSLATMAESVRKFGLQIELLKFMVALNLLLLAIQLIAAIIAAFFTGGTSLAAVMPMIRATGATIASLAARTLTTIASFSLRTALRNLPRLLPRALPSATRLGAPNLVRNTLPTLARTQLPNLVRTQLPNLVRTQLPTLVRTQFPNLIRTQLPNLVRTALPAMRNAATTFVRNIPAHLARNLLPKNVIARTVANRMANQWMRSMASRQLLRGLGQQAAARGLTQASLVSARNALAWQIEQQLLRRFGTNVAANFVERGAANAVARMAESGIARQVTSQALAQQAARMTAQVSFGRELFKYMLPRVALGTAFMGGGNLLGQLIQIAEGHRTSVDWGEVSLYTGQGALFGAALWGGVLGQGIGGGLAGGAFAIGTEAWDHFKHGEEFDWGEVGRQAAHGAFSGALFGVADQFQMSRLPVPSRIGHEVAAMPHPRADRPVLVMRDPNSGTGVILDRDAGALLQRGDGTQMWLDREGNLVWSSETGPRPEAGEPAPSRPDEPLALSRPLAGELAPGDGPPPDGPPGGPDRGQPGQPDAQAPAETRAPDLRQVLNPESTRAADPPVPPAGAAEVGPARDAPPPVRVSEAGPTSDTPAPTRVVEVTPTSDGPPPARVVEAGSTTDTPPPTRVVDAGPAADTPPPSRSGLEQPTTERSPVGPEHGFPADRGPEPEAAPPLERGSTERGAPPEQVRPPDPAGVDRGPAPERGTLSDPGPVEPRAGSPDRTTAPERSAPHQERDVAPVEASRSLPERASGEAPARVDRPVHEQGPLSRPRDGHEDVAAPVWADQPEAPVARERPPAGPDGPPPPHESRSPDAPRPETAPASRDAEPMLRSAGAEDGEPPSPRSIEQGTVRMEEHPDFPAVLRELEERGFTLVETSGNPHVVVRHVVDRQGNLIRIERELHARPGMRFIDLEHELGHVRQMTDPNRFPDGPLPSEHVWERPDGSRVQPRAHGPELKKWQDNIVEYHVRLEEFLRLAERGVDRPILEAHARGVDKWRALYEESLSTRKDRRGEHKQWAETHFPDIPELQRRVAQVRGMEAGEAPPPAENPPRGRSEGRLEKADEPPSQERRGGWRRLLRFWRSDPPTEPAQRAHTAETTAWWQEQSSQAEARRDPQTSGEVAWPPYDEYPASPRGGAAGQSIGGDQGQPYRPAYTTFDDNAFAPPHDGVAPPVIGADRVQPPPGFPSEPPQPRQVTPEWVRGTVDDPATPPWQRDAVQRHFTTPREPYGYAPRSQAEIDQALARFGEEATRAIHLPPSTHPPAATPPGHYPAGPQYGVGPQPHHQPPGGPQYGPRPAGHPSGPSPAWPQHGAQPGHPHGTSPVGPSPSHPSVPPAHGRPPTAPPHGHSSAAPPTSHPPAPGHAPVGADHHGRPPVPGQHPHAADPGQPGRHDVDVTRPSELDGTSGERSLSLDEYWSDPPWRREQRRPSMDELIPGSDLEADRYADAIYQEFARLLDGQEFDGMRIRLQPGRDGVWAYKNGVVVKATIYDETTNRVAGGTTRVFSRDYDGTLYVEHSRLHLEDWAQGRQFAPKWNRFLQDWYEYSGVDRIEIRAASTVGGYAWAKAGFYWAAPHHAENMFGRLRVEMREAQAAIDRLLQWPEGEPIDPQLRQRYGYDHEDPRAFAAELQREVDEARAVLKRAAEHDFGTEEFPTPYDVAMAGHKEGLAGKDATWLGKRALLGADWRGVKFVSDTGPQYKRPPLAEGGPHRPTDPEGQPPGRITAEELGGFRGHGGEVDPVANLEAVKAAARSLASEYSDLPGPGYRLRWESDPLLRQDQLVVTADGGRPVFALRFTVGEVPEGTVAFTDPTPARTQTGAPIYETTISDRIPAADRELVARRVVAHEVAEQLEQLRLGESHQTQLQGVTARSPHGFDPHETGMLAELRLELRDGEVSDPAGQAARDLRIRHLLYRLTRSHQPDDIVSYLESTGHDAHVDHVRDLLSLDRYWSDPIWKLEERSPSLRELIPGSEYEAARWADAIRQEFHERLDGRTFAGLRVEIESIGVEPGAVRVRAAVLDGATNERVGTTSRDFYLGEDGKLRVLHVGLHLDSQVQARGFAAEWNAFLEDWYRYSGVNEVNLLAATPVGGYAWAKAGFYWADGPTADMVFGRLEAKIAEAEKAAEIFEGWPAEKPIDKALSDLLGRYGYTLDPADPSLIRRVGYEPGPGVPDTFDLKAVARELRGEVAEARALLDKRAHGWGDPDFPTPFDVAMVGHKEGLAGKDARWLGKLTMLETGWSGTKTYEVTGSPPSRPHLFVPDGQASGHVTAETVAGTPGDGVPREPTTLAEAARTAAEDLANTHADLPGNGYHLRWDADSKLLIAKADDPRLPAVALRFAVGAVREPDPAVTHPTPDRTADGVPIYQTLISESVPADRQLVRRIVAHELAELLEERRPRSFVDRLRDTLHLPSRAFDPNEAGLLAELRLELSEGRAPDHAGQAARDQRIGQLLDQLTHSRRLTDILSYLESTGHRSDLDYVRGLADPNAPWRSHADPQPRPVVEEGTRQPTDPHDHVPGRITAEELGGFPGHGGPVDRVANELAVRVAAGELADSHVGLPGSGYRLRWDAGSELLFAEAADPRLPAVALRFTAGEVPDGTVAFTKRTSDEVAGVPVYETTISDRIPEADRQLVARRVVAHEVAELLETLRRGGFAELMHRGPGRVAEGFDPHELGMLAELRLELRDGQALDPVGQAARDLRVRHLLYRLARSHEPEDIVSYLESAGHHSDVEYVRRLLSLETYWSDPVWRLEDRQPSLNELLPRSEYEATRWADAIKAEFSRLLDGRQFVGMRVQLESVSVSPDAAVVEVVFRDAATDEKVGWATRIFHRHDTGTLSAYHFGISLDKGVQGKGFASDWNRFLEEWYRYSGVKEVALTAAGDVGGYAWAENGFYWADAESANGVFRRLEGEMAAARDAIATFEEWPADRPIDQTLRTLLKSYGYTPDPDNPLVFRRDGYDPPPGAPATFDLKAIASELGRAVAEAEALLEKRVHGWGHPDYPTPMDVAMVGHQEGLAGKDATWLGKRTLIGSSWRGFKPISETDPVHSRPTSFTDEPPPSTDSGGRTSGVITAEELRGLPGHGGPRDLNANVVAARLAAEYLAAHHADLPGGGYGLRWESDPAHGPLLVVEAADRRLPAVALQFAAGEVPDGRVAFTQPTTERTAAGVPIFRTTISDSIPVESRPLVARRVVAHEVAELLEQLRPRSFAERFTARLGAWLGRPSRFDGHELGMLAELRLELRETRAVDPFSGSVRDHRIGQLLDRLTRSHRLDDIVSHLEALGHHSDVDYVRGLADPAAAWRSEAFAVRRDEGLSAVGRALIRLSADDVRVFADGQVSPDGATARIGVATEGNRVETVEIPITDLVDDLARSEAVGERLGAKAVVELTARLADRAGDRLGPPWGDGAGVASVRALLKLLDALPAERAPEYHRALQTVLDGLGADELRALREGQLPESLRRGVLDRQVTAVLHETLGALTGEGPGRLAVDVAWRSDGGVSLTGHDGRVRQVPASTVDWLKGWLRGRIGDTDLPTVRAETAAALAAVLGPYTDAATRSAEVRVLGALGELWAAPDQPAAVRTAAEAVAGDVIAGHALRPADIEALPESARQLVAAAPPVSRSAEVVDPHAPLRTSRTRAAVNELDRLLNDLVDASAADRVARTAVAADAASRLADTLDAAAAELRRRSEALLDSALTHDQQAAATLQKAVEGRGRSDQWSEQRYEDGVAEAEKDRIVAERHLARAGTYQDVSHLARTARDTFHILADELSALQRVPDAEWRSRASQVTTWAQEAAEAYRRYQEAMDRAQPALDLAVPVRRMPYLNALVTKVNTMLAGLGIDHRLQAEDLQRELLASWHKVFRGDGAVLTVADGAAELHVRFRRGDAVEVVNPPESGAELAVSMLPQTQNIGVHGAVMNRAFGLNVAPDLSPLLNVVGSHLPDVEVAGLEVVPAVREALRHSVLKLNFRYGPSWSIAGEGAEFGLAGSVFAVKNDLPLFDVDGVWEVRLRSTGNDADWSEPAVVDRGGEGDRAGLQMLVPHSHVDPAPSQPITIDRPLTDRFPEHVAILDRTETLRDATLRLIESAGGRVSEPLRRVVHSLIEHDLAVHLKEAIDPGHGWRRTLWVDGEPVGIVKVKAEVVPGSVRMVGGPSNQAPLEHLRLSIVQSTGSTTVTSSRGHGYESGVKALDSDRPDAEAVFSVTFPRSKGSSTSEGLHVARVAIHPNVQRSTGHTQSYSAEIRYDITVQVFDGSRVRDTESGTGLFAVKESDAYRYGWPVDPAALRLDQHGAVVRDRDGNEVLRDDPLPGAPTGRTTEFPEWLGPDGIGGAGPANVSHMTGVEALRAQLEERLRSGGWLPELDEQGFPKLSSTRVERLGQLENLRQIEELTASRLEAHYDQLVQQGLVLDFVKHRVNHAPEHLTLRVKLIQKKPVLIGHTRSEAVVNLDIGRHVMARTGGETLERSFGVQASAGKDVSGTASGARPTSVSSNWQMGEAVHQGTLVESNGPTAVFKVPHILEVRQVRADGEYGSLWAGGDLDGVGHGEARVVLPGDLLPEKKPAPSTMVPREKEPVSARVLTELKVVHVDTSRLPDTVRLVLPEGSKPGSAGYQHLAAFINVRNLVAAPQWLYGDYRTDHVVDPRGLGPRRSSLSIKGALRGGLTFVGAARLVSADINFAMDVHSLTLGQDRGRTVGGGGTAFVTGGGYDFGTRSGSSYGSELIKGRERLDPVAGIHYVFRGVADLTVTGTEHSALLVGWKSTKSEPLPGKEFVGIIPEARALALYADGDLPLPLAQVKDALARYHNGDLNLDPWLAERVNQRYEADAALVRKAGATASPVPDAPHGAPAAPEAAGTKPPAADATVPAPRSGPDATDWRLPEHLHEALGQGGAELAYIVGPDGRPREPVALFNEVVDHIEKVSPDALERMPGLKQALAGQFAGRSWSGKLERMLSPTGWEFEVPVRAGFYGVEFVTVTIRARFLDTHPDAGPGSGWRIGDAPDDGSVLQDYGYRQSTSRLQGTRSHAESAQVKDAPVSVSTPDVEGEVSRARTGAVSTSAQTTRVQRLSSFDGVHLFERPIEIAIEVKSRFGDALKDQPVRAYRRLTGGRVESSGVIRAAVIQKVPDGLLQPAASAEPAPATVPVPGLPDRYGPEVVDVADLSRAARDLLAHKDLLGQDGVAAREVVINRAVSRLGADAGLEWMHAPGGHAVVELSRPGHPDEFVRLVVKAEPADEGVVVASRSKVQIGHDTRSQHLVGQRYEHDRLLPASQSVGDDHTVLGGGTAGYAKGESAAENSQVTAGSRSEHKAWQEGKGSTVKVDVTFRLSAERFRMKGGSLELLARREASEPIRGHAYLTAYDSELTGPVTKPGTGRWRVDGPSVTAPAERRSWLSGWFGPDDAATTVALDGVLTKVAAGPDFSPVDAPSAVAARLAQDLGRRWEDAPVIHLDAAGAARFGVDPLAIAAEVASRRGGDVLVNVHAADGSLAPYWVSPDGAIHPVLPDGGYLTTRATLPPELVARAQEARLDLRSLYQASVRANRAFADVVIEALGSAGRAVPSATLGSVSGTHVLMADGTTKPIAEVRLGDEVWAADPQTGRAGPRAVTAVWTRNETVVDLILDDGTVLPTTVEREFWNETDQQWQRADELDPGDLLVTSDERTVQVKGVDPTTTRSETIHHITVEDDHTYFVVAGDTPVLVHNHIPAPKNLPGFPQAKRVKPKTPVQGGGSLRPRWKDNKGNIYEWDFQHGEVEMYNKRGKHLGAFDPETGEQIKPADPGRRTVL